MTKEQWHMEFKNMLGIVIRKHGYHTFNMFAESFGIGQANLSRYLNGYRTPSKNMLLDIAEFLNEPIENIAPKSYTVEKELY